MGEPRLRRILFLVAASAVLVAPGCSFITDGAGDDTAAEAPDELPSETGDITVEGETTEGESGDDDGTTDNGDDATTTTTPPVESPDWEELPLELELIAEFEEPVALSARSGSFDLYVAERAGIIRRIEITFSEGANRERISVANRAVLDISEMVTTDSERGLLGLAFSTDGRFLYVSYTDLAGDSVVDEYDIERRTEVVVDSRRELLRVPQPFSNHNGGHLALGADGFLYLGLGDGGSANDPQGHGQNTDTLLGSIIRIDPFPDGEESAYSIPSGNPFAIDGGGAPEIFLWGVRNPWRFSFDQLTGDLWIGDVGQDQFEEINHLPAATGGGRGANLGWAGFEANAPVEGAVTPEDHVGPAYTYAHEKGRCSVTGGYVYRGELHPSLDGVYIYGDYCSGEIIGLQMTDQGNIARLLSVKTERDQLVSFGEGADGELYVINQGGQVLRIEPLEVTDEEG